MDTLIYKCVNTHKCYWVCRRCLRGMTNASPNARIIFPSPEPNHRANFTRVDIAKAFSNTNVLRKGIKQILPRKKKEVKY